MQRANLIGRRFTRLTVIDKAPKEYRSKPHWICLCDCGQISIVMTTNLLCENTKSCGCFIRELTSKRSIKHGHARTNKVSGEFRAWLSAKERCLNPNHPAYAEYGGRGISMCNDWINNFQAFFDYLGTRPQGHSLDRINNNGNYEPGNVRWATQLVQSNNTRSAKIIEYEGKRLSIRAWAREKNIPASTIRLRLSKGLSLGEVFHV